MKNLLEVTKSIIGCVCYPCYLLSLLVLSFFSKKVKDKLYDTLVPKPKDTLHYD